MFQYHLSAMVEDCFFWGGKVTIEPRSSKLCLTCILHDLPYMSHLFQTPRGLWIEGAPKGAIKTMKEGHIQLLFCFLPSFRMPSVRPHGLCAVATTSYCEVLWFVFAGISLDKCQPTLQPCRCVSQMLTTAAAQPCSLYFGLMPKVFLCVIFLRNSRS
jgi:hypothetical protein